MFAGIAPRYDLLNHLLSFQVDRLWRRAAVREAAPVAETRVLDICAGTGDLSLAFSRRGARVVGTDFCPEMIRIARTKAGRLGPPAASARFAVADALRLPFRDRAFDRVCVAFGVRNLSDWRGGIAEMARVARPGGRVLVLEFARPRNRLLRRVFFFYFRKVVPAVGRIISGDPEAYTYLPESVLSFVGPEELARAMRDEGLEEVSVRPLTGGISALIVGKKGDALT